MDKIILCIRMERLNTKEKCLNAKKKRLNAKKERLNTKTERLNAKAECLNTKHRLNISILQYCDIAQILSNNRKYLENNTLNN